MGTGASAGAVVGGLVLSATVTAALMEPLCRLLVRIRLIDVPGVRSSHVDPVPRGGGIGPAVGVVAALLLVGTSLGEAGITLVGTATCFALVGLGDDLGRGSPVALRLAGQVTCGTLLTVPWTLAVADERGANGILAVLLAVGTVIWTVGFVNVFNFMDGIDGISGSVAAVLGTTAIIVGSLEDVALLQVGGAVLVGAGLGFLPWNLGHRVFLGDVGSYFLGGWIAVLVLLGPAAGLPVEAVAAATVPYIADTAVTLLRRLRAREAWWESHHEHTYQRLVDLGWTHQRVSLLVAAASAVCGALGLLSLTGSAVLRPLGWAGVALAAGAYLHSPAWVRPGR